MKPMNLANKLLLCQQCTKRGFNPKTGINCSLTGEKPAFENECQDFNRDEKVDPSLARQIANDAVRKPEKREPITAKTIGGIILTIIIVAVVIGIRIAIRYGRG